MIAIFASAAGVRSVASRRLDRVENLRSSAEAAISEAHRQGAARWAPGDLLLAEASFRAALAQTLVERGRYLLLPDLEAAELGFRDALQAASGAQEEALAFSASTREAAETEIGLTEKAVGFGERLAGSIHLGTTAGSLLIRSRSLLQAARVAHKTGDHESAIRVARNSRDLAMEVRGAADRLAERYSDTETVERWQRLKREAIDWSRRQGAAALVVSKHARIVTLYVGGSLVRTYSADLGLNWIEDKLLAGDGATPEGLYHVSALKGRGQSLYYKALLLDYPNAEDRRDFDAAVREGRIPRTSSIGGLIEIHGEGGQDSDWTEGCVALSNADMDDLFARVSVGTPVAIIGHDETLSLEQLLR